MFSKIKIKHRKLSFKIIYTILKSSRLLEVSIYQNIFFFGLRLQDSDMLQYNIIIMYLNVNRKLSVHAAKCTSVLYVRKMI